MRERDGDEEMRVDSECFFILTDGELARATDDGIRSSAMMIGSGFRGDSSREDTGDEGGAGATGDDGAHGSRMFE